MDNLQFYKEKGSHPQRVFEYFSFDQLDAFHNQNILSAVYGKEWYSILITYGRNALFHTFYKHRIGDSGWFDIEPVLGYNGPVVNTDDKEFLCKAIRLYSDFCKEEKIVAEVIRFNCILNNHYLFKDIPSLHISPTKQIVVVSCMREDDKQLKEFNEPCRRRVKSGLRNCEFKILNKEDEWMSFLMFYFNSLKRVGADRKWYFSQDFFERVRTSEYFQVYSVYHEGKIASASLVIEYPFAGYYLLAGNSDELIHGANESLIFHITRSFAKKDIPFLILGGGNSSSLDDPLFRFKKKFAKTTYIFFIGKMIHMPDIYKKLVDEAIRKRPDIETVNFFLKYRLTEEV